jgi:hypothetical protein
MPRARERLTLESDPVLDLGKIIPKGAAKPGVHVRNVWTFSIGEVIGIEVRLWEEHGSLDLSFEGRRQSFTLTPFAGQPDTRYAAWAAACSSI